MACVGRWTNWCKAGPTIARRPASSPALDDDCHRIARFRQDLADLERYVADLRRRLALPDDQLGHRR